MGADRSKHIEINEEIWKNLPKEKIIKTKSRILVSDGNIEEHKAEALVNLICGLSDKGEWQGRVSTAFRCRGGSDLFKAFQETDWLEESVGVVTRAKGELTKNCKRVFHIYLPIYSAESCLPLLQHLREKIHWCLEMATQFGLKSIAFPTLGCGQMGYPVECVSRCFLEAVSLCACNIKVTIVGNHGGTVQLLRQHLYPNGSVNLVPSLQEYAKSIGLRNSSVINDISTATATAANSYTGLPYTNNTDPVTNIEEDIYSSDSAADYLCPSNAQNLDEEEEIYVAPATYNMYMYTTQQPYVNRSEVKTETYQRSSVDSRNSNSTPTAADISGTTSQFNTSSLKKDEPYIPIPRTRTTVKQNNIVQPTQKHTAPNLIAAESEKVNSLMDSFEQELYVNTQSSSSSTPNRSVTKKIHRPCSQNGVEITVIKQSLTKTKADAHVCPVYGDTGDPKKSGFLLSEFLELGGDELKQSSFVTKLLPTYHRPIIRNSTAYSQSYGQLVNFCSYIIFVHVMNFVSVDSEPILQFMTGSIERCLSKAKKLGLKSIAFSTIGCGRMRYPADSVIQCFKDAVSTSGAGLKVIICAMDDMYDKFKQHFPNEHLESEIGDEAAGSVEDTTVQSDLEARSVSIVTTKLYVPDYWLIRGYRIKELTDNCGHIKSVLSSSTNAFKRIQKLIISTWQPENVGLGRDAAGLIHKSLEVLNIFCIENPSQLKKYNNAKEPLEFRKRTSGPYTKLEEQPLTAPHMGAVLSQNLDPDINEFYLFHGTSALSRDGISVSGLDVRLSNSSGLFGSGVYLAESSTKADQYTGRTLPDAPDEKLYMFVCRVALGNPFMCTSPRPFKKAPCQNNCLSDTCADSAHFPHFDSVIGTHHYDDRKLLFREFILYDQHRCYPEFLVEYKRTY